MKPVQISEHLYKITDSCNVYLIVGEHASTLVDFGSGAGLLYLDALHAPPVTHVLLTHHHRDQAQGLATISSAPSVGNDPNTTRPGLQIWAPYNEQELLADVDNLWQRREIFNNYNVRQDRFSLLEPVSLDGLLEDYAHYEFSGIDFEVIPTPGHTPGSISLAASIDGQEVIFCGDLIYAPGKVWSLAATQWSYNGGEGLPATVASLVDLKARRADILLPSHGEPIREVASSIDLTVERLVELMAYRQQNPRLLNFIEQPYTAVTTHLLRSNQNVANSFVLISKNGLALMIDFGYDFMTGMPPGADRAAHRPWLYSLKNLKKNHGIRKIDAVIPTHYHDDHVAGINLLKRVEGTQAWIPGNFSSILAEPSRYDLPCLWYDPFNADRILSVDQPVEWQEYRLTLYPFPGHTHYAVAISFEVDYKRVLAVGDQYQNNDGLLWNYVYQNRFQAGDYRLTAELYARLKPDLILSGHWDPLWVGPDYFSNISQRGAALESIHHHLLPDEISAFDAEGFGARIEPYQSWIQPGEPLQLVVEVKNAAHQPTAATVKLVLPAGWQAEPLSRQLELPGDRPAQTTFMVIPPVELYEVRRARLAVDLTIGGHYFGQQAEALVSITKRKQK